MMETKTLKRFSTNSDVKMEVNSISDYLKPNIPLPQYLPYTRFLLDTDLSHTAKLLYTLLLDRATLSQKNNWIDCTGSHLCSLSAFQAVKRFEIQPFQHNTRICRIGKRTARGTCPQRLFQAQPHSAQGSVHYAKLRCHSMQKCQG